MSTKIFECYDFFAIQVICCIVLSRLLKNKSIKIFAITPQGPGKRFYFPTSTLHLKLFCQKIMNSDPQLLIHIFNVKYLKIMY